MSRSLSVAIVDDEKDLTLVLKKGFVRRGIEVSFVAHNGREAVELLKQAEKKPDVVIMDYWMPGVDGVTAAREMLAIAPGVKIIFLSGERLSEEEALGTGAIGLIRKPASLSKLVDAIRESA